mmetsp:Transcript_3724/g.8299  ORF Transcript_3724/g.8299 Transcript_3724/m.8299 type:complete len:211 (+) Transcript_3724:287-919(+)
MPRWRRLTRCACSARRLRTRRSVRSAQRRSPAKTRLVASRRWSCDAASWRWNSPTPPRRVRTRRASRSCARDLRRRRRRRRPFSASRAIVSSRRKRRRRSARQLRRRRRPRRLSASVCARSLRRSQAGICQSTFSSSLETTRHARRSWHSERRGRTCKSSWRRRSWTGTSASRHSSATRRHARARSATSLAFAMARRRRRLSCARRRRRR